MTATLTKTLGSLDDFRGTLCVPGDPDYPRVRAIWNGQVAREPALIATCHDACDVRTVLRRAVDAGMVTAVTVLLVVGVSALLAVLFSWLTYGNLLLRRGGSGQEGVLHLRHGLLRVREHTYDMRRLRGATLREPLLVRLLRGARLDAVISSCTGGAEDVVSPVASLLVCGRVTSNDTETTSATAAIMAATPTTHGQRGAASSSSRSDDSS